MTSDSSNFIFEKNTSSMQSNQNTGTILPDGDSTKASLSPRELIRYHIENPEEPITDDDIRNLNLKKQRVVDFMADEFSRE